MVVLNREVFLEDPTKTDIPNDGVTKVTQPESEQQWRVLRHELRTFVCKGEYERGLVTILSSFLDHVHQSSQPAGWVSGFYGSGKSHLVRVLEHLWRDTEFPDGDTARNIVSLPTEITEYLRELTTLGRQRGGLWSAAGTLSASGDVEVRLAILAVILRAAGLPENYAQAQLVIRLKQEGVWDQVVGHLKANNRSPERELQHMYASQSLHAAIVAAYPMFASDVAGAKALIRDQYPRRTDVSNAELVRTIEDVLDLVTDTPGRRPCALIVLDEVQQFIGSDPQIALEVQEAVETCCSHFGSTLLFIATGQAQLAASAQLQRLQGRFSINVHLQDVDIEEVIREVVLQKQPARRGDVATLLEQTSGEIDRQLRGTPFSVKAEDAKHLVADYPLLPSRRRFWEAVLRAVDTGTTGQLRTQLRIVHAANADIADKPLGNVIPGDRIYTHVRSGVLNSGALQREVANTIDALANGNDSEHLRSRICSTIFLIERVATESSTPTGLRPTAEILADLLVEDLNAGGEAFRQRVNAELGPLVEAGTLERVNDEYHLQTAEGAEWERDFRSRETRIRNDDVRIPSERATILRNAVATALKPIQSSLRQGVSNEKRELELHFGDDLPKAAGGVPVWAPVSWSLTEGQLLAQAAQAGTNSPIVFVHLPRKNADALRDAIAAVGAAQETLGQHGVPSTDAGRQARAGMGSRQEMAQARLNALVQDILADARVFQGGGNEIADGGNLAGNVRIAADNALDRLYTEFRHADHVSWPRVAQQAGQGAQNAMEAVGHQGATAQHAVTREIIAYVGGAGKRGAEVREHFKAPPYGWSQDAVDGALLALLANEMITARHDGHDATAHSLTRPNMSRAEFRVPNPDEMPTVQERTDVRGFIFGITGKQPNRDALSEEAAGALQLLLTLANEASGPPPFPARGSTTTIEELQGLTGNSRVKAMAANLDALKASHAQWKADKQAIAIRKPRWELLSTLLEQAEAGKLPIASDVRDQVDAIRDNRSLLAEPDPTKPLIEQLGSALRSQLVELHNELEEARWREIRVLGDMREWDEVGKERTEGIVERVGLQARESPDLGTDDLLVKALRQTPISTLATERAAIPGRAEQARQEIIIAAKPRAVSVTLPRRTLETPEDIDAWLAEAREKLLDMMKTDDGRTRPVIV